MTNTDFSLPEGTHTVVMGLGDLNGIMRGKRFPASHWENVCESGNALSTALFALDMTCDVWDTPYVNFENGYPDMHSKRPVVTLPGCNSTASARLAC